MSVYKFKILGNPAIMNPKTLRYQIECEDVPNSFTYTHRKSPEWVVVSNIPSICYSSEKNSIYPKCCGMLPNYGGHVPGEMFKAGESFGKSTVNAKRWLELNRMNY